MSDEYDPWYEAKKWLEQCRTTTFTNWRERYLGLLTTRRSFRGVSEATKTQSARQKGAGNELHN
jgi:hypothetical protein